MVSKNMKKIFEVTALACLMAVASNAMAIGPSANVQVKGTVKMGACTPTLDNGGIVDYGDISSDVLNQNSNQLAHKYINLTITCTTATKLEWYAMDNRIGSAFGGNITDAGMDGSTQDVGAGNNQMGLGKTTGDVKIGAYVVAVQVPQVSVDGSTTAYDAVKRANTTVWSVSSLGLLGNGSDTGSTVYYSIADKGTAAPVPFTTAVFPLKISAALNNRENLALNDVVSIDGNNTFTINYI